MRPSRSHPVSRRERALLARKWAYQVSTTTYIPLPYPEIEAELLALVDSLFDAVRQGDVSVDAEGTGDGRMTLSLTNRTSKKLCVVLPPGLIASGVTGQFGGEMLELLERR